ncbi:hypothetical protein ACIQAC_04610 [Streptomyces sp. NPDC088387]|uniref:hypothetical protein n=1 Tax=Streptomyces sp. NPDC088387 TaxID=3365859 RepID=UPI00381FE061
MPSDSLNGLFVALTGESWPEVRPEDIYRRMQLPHEELERWLGEFQQLVVQVAQTVSTNATGEWSEEFRRAVLALASGSGADVLERLKQAARQLADYSRETAYQALYTIRMIIGQLVTFVFEWAMTLILAIYNPLAALVKQVFLRALYRLLLSSTLFRFLTALGMHVFMNVSISSAMDLLARWALENEGKYTRFGDQYLRQSAAFGAVQGVLAPLVVPAASAIASGLGKLFTRNVAEDVFGVLDEQLVMPGQGSGPGPVSSQGRTFAREVADGVGSYVATLERDGFRDGMGRAFVRGFDGVLDPGAARTLGREWADTLATNLTAKNLPDLLNTVLRGLPSDVGDHIRTALSTGVGRVLRPDWGHKFAMFTGLGLAEGIHQTVSEVAYNLFTTKKFQTTSGTFVSGIVGGRLSGGLESFGHWNGDLVKGLMADTSKLFANPLPLEVTTPTPTPTVMDPGTESELAHAVNTELVRFGRPDLRIERDEVPWHYDQLLPHQSQAPLRQQAFHIAGRVAGLGDRLVMRGGTLQPPPGTAESEAGPSEPRRTVGPSRSSGPPSSSSDLPRTTVSDRVLAELTGHDPLADNTTPDTPPAEPPPPTAPYDPPTAPIQRDPAELSTSVRQFGGQRGMPLDLVHIDPVPQRTVEWLHERVIGVVEGAGRRDDAFRAEVRRVLTGRLLSAEWARLLSESGLPLRVPHGNVSYPVSLRLALSDPGRADSGMEPLSDGGPPVAVQRWAFGIAETNDTVGEGGLRPGSVAYSHTFDVDRGALRQLALGPQLNMVHNQANSVVTMGRLVQPIVVVRSGERTFPFSYTMDWEVRPGDPTAGLATGRLPTGGWQGLARPTPDRLVAWFPQHLADAEAPTPVVDPADPTTRPTPVARLLDEVPLYGPLGLADHDKMFADVMASFRTPLRGLSADSLHELREFFSEGNLRANLPLMWGGSLPSPTLYTSSGAEIGYLRVGMDLHGGDVSTGPVSQDVAVSNYVLRSLRVQGTSSVTNSLGVNLPVPGLAFGFGGTPDERTGLPGRGGALTVQAGAQHTFVHTLSAGGSARMMHSLRTSKPLLQVTPETTLRVALVRPSGPPVAPADRTPLAGAGRRYRVTMKVPSEDVLGETPTRARYLPPHLLDLTSLGMSTTPLQAEGALPLFDRAETELRGRGFLPSTTEGSRLSDTAARTSIRSARLDNIRKLDQARLRLGLRSELDEMVEGGANVTFDLPTTTGMRRATLTLVAERHYPGGDDDPHEGVEHERSLPDVHTLNIYGSVHSGEEQFSSTPLAWNAGVNGAVTNPFDSTDGSRLNRAGAEYTYSRGTAKVRGYGSGTGQEYYAQSPTAEGVQIFGVPVTYRMTLAFSHRTSPDPAPWTERGRIRLAVPTHRTLTDRAEATRPAPVVVRDHQQLDDTRLALPGAGHTFHDDVLLLPETAWLDRVEGSSELKRTVHNILEGLERETAALEEAAEQAPPMPGGLDVPRTPLAEEPAPTTTAPTTTAPVTPAPTTPSRTAAFGTAVTVAGWAATTAVRWVAESTGVAGTWRFVKRIAVGEPDAQADSATEQVHRMALSPHHLSVEGVRIFRDGYVIEGGGTSGALAGSDVTVEIRGYVTDVQLLPQPPKMDIERWLQATDFSTTDETTTAGHRIAGVLAGQAGDTARSFDPAGTYRYTNTTARSTRVNDDTRAFRATVDEGGTVHRLVAKAVYVVTVRKGLNNILAGTFHPGLHLERTRVVEVPDGLEFLLVDNDLRNHPDLREIGDFPEPVPATPADRMLPSWYVDSGGVLSSGTVTEVRLRNGRNAFHNTVRAAVETHAPGSTFPGHATYLRNVLTRINEHTSTVGLRSLPDAGPGGHTAFHFVHRSWLGPRLVEVTLGARPVPDADELRGLRGRSAESNSAVYNLFARSHGDGGALSVPGATRVGTTRTTGHGLEFEPLGQVRGNQGRPRLGLSGSWSTTRAQTSARELRHWKRTFQSVDFKDVSYEFTVTVTSRPLNESLLVRLVGAGLQGLVWAGEATHLLALAGPALTHLPRPVGRTVRTEAAVVSLRFEGAEAPLEGSAPDPAGQPAPVEPTAPAVYDFDPAVRPEAPRDAVVVQVEPDPVPATTRTLLDGPPWLPTRPIQLYSFGALPQLAQALRAVDPGSAGRQPETTRPRDGVLLRLRELVASDRPTLLKPAQLAAFLGHEGGSGTSVRVTLRSPRPEATSRDVALDRMEISTDGFISQSDMTTTLSTAFGGSGLDADAENRGGPSVPVLGGTTSVGQGSLVTNQRREVVRFGTTSEGADGTGLIGHRVTAIAVIEVRGPKGVRWVVGDLVFRTTETPPTPPAPAPAPAPAAHTP